LSSEEPSAVKVHRIVEGVAAARPDHISDRAVSTLFCLLWAKILADDFRGASLDLSYQ